MVIRCRKATGNDSKLVLSMIYCVCLSYCPHELMIVCGRPLCNWPVVGSRSENVRIQQCFVKR